MERIDLAAVHSAARQQWRNGDFWDAAAVKVLVGEISDGRWYVRRYGGAALANLTNMKVCGEYAIAYAGPDAEHYARATARRWMRTVGGDWVES